MVRIRMQRFGRRHRPFYRINAIDQRTRRNGRVLENLGYYNPMDPDESKQIVLKGEKIQAWLAKGAQPSDTVRDMLGHADLLDAKMRAVWEADRAVNMNRGKCKAAVKRCEAAVDALEKLAEDADITSFLNSSKKALTLAKSTLSLAKSDVAEKAAGEAEAALAGGQKAAAAEKPAEEAADEAAE
jgi:small subunit ribosomal protein S16